QKNEHQSERAFRVGGWPARNGPAFPGARQKQNADKHLADYTTCLAGRVHFAQHKVRAHQSWRSIVSVPATGPELDPYARMSVSRPATWDKEIQSAIVPNLMNRNLTARRPLTAVL